MFVLVMLSFNVFASYYNISYDVQQDGFIEYDSSGNSYSRQLNFNLSFGYYTDGFTNYYKRSFIDFDLSTTPFISSKIVAIKLNLTRNGTGSNIVNISYLNLASNTSNYADQSGVGQGNQLLFNNISNETHNLLIATNTFTSPVDLGSNAINVIRDHPSWFSIGLALQDESLALNWFYSGDSKLNNPKLILYLDNISTEINLASPQHQSSNNSATTPVTTIFKFNATDDSTINNCTLNLGNGTTIAISSISTTNSYSINLANGTYQWNVSCIDSYDNTNTSLTRTYYVNDSKAPDISSLGSSTTTTSSTITWTTNEKANATVYYSTSNTDVRSNIATSTSFITSQSLTINSLSSSTTYYYNASSCDELNNCNSTGVNSFTTASSGGSGGGEGEAEAEAEAESEAEAEAEAEAESEAEAEAESEAEAEAEKEPDIEGTSRNGQNVFRFTGLKNVSNENIGVERDFSYDNETNTTTIGIIIQPKKDLINFSYYEQIPKCIATLIRNNIDIKFYDESMRIEFNNPNFEVVEEDPLIVWHFDKVNAGETIDLSYRVDKQVLEDCMELLEALGIASGFEEERPGFIAIMYGFIKNSIKSLYTEKGLTNAGKTFSSIMITVIIVAFVIFIEKVKPEIEKKGLKNTIKEITPNKEIVDKVEEMFIVEPKPEKKFIKLFGELLKPKKAIPKINLAIQTIIKKIDETKQKIKTAQLEVHKQAIKSEKQKKLEMKKRVAIQKGAEESRLLEEIQRNKEKALLASKIKEIRKEKVLFSKKIKEAFVQPKIIKADEQTNRLKEIDIKINKNMTPEEVMKELESKTMIYDKIMSRHKGMFSRKLYYVDRKINGINHKS